mmetsp:Transcript_63322/g.118958  ORF Transcript_63322/g.118958 Transcript_63322/m.118958 type:complete len:138 (+) Transcript_63322:116-529(+)
MEAADKELLLSFTEVVVDLLIEQHDDRTPYSIKLTFKDDRLTWKGGRSVGPSSVERELLIRDITLVAIGAGAKGFGTVNVPEDHCLSLITKPKLDSGLDVDELNLICSSKVEREALAEGFGMLVTVAQNDSWGCAIS